MSNSWLLGELDRMAPSRHIIAVNNGTGAMKELGDRLLSLISAGPIMSDVTTYDDGTPKWMSGVTPLEGYRL